MRVMAALPQVKPLSHKISLADHDSKGNFNAGARAKGAKKRSQLFDYFRCSNALVVTLAASCCPFTITSFKISRPRGTHASTLKKLA